MIIRLVRNNRYIPLSELVRKVEDGLAYYDDTGDIGVSRRTILRDLQEIPSASSIRGRKKAITYRRTKTRYPT